MSTVFEPTSGEEACYTLLKYSAEPAFFSAHGAWRRWTVATIVAVLVFVPLVFLKYNEQEVKKASSGSGNSLVSLPPPSENMGDELSDLYDWLSMASPKSGPRPDFEQGFSRYAYPQYKVLPVEIPEFRLQAVSLPKYKAAPQVVKPASQPTNEGLVAETWDYFGLPVEYSVVCRYPVSGWYWHIDGDRTLAAADTPELTPEARAALEAAPEPLGSSEFDIVFAPELPLPRILLRESCGNPELDRQAMLSLRKWLLPTWKKNKDFLALPVRRISIDWRLP